MRLFKAANVKTRQFHQIHPCCKQCCKHPSTSFSFDKEPGVFPASERQSHTPRFSLDTSFQLGHLPASAEIVGKVSKTNAPRIRTSYAVAV